MSEAAVEAPKARKPRPPEEAPSILPIAPVEPHSGLPDGCLPMDEAPMDGKPILVAGRPKADDPLVEVEALWRNTRRADPRNGRWEPTAFWALRNSGGAKVPFQPLWWRAL